MVHNVNTEGSEKFDTFVERWWKASLAGGLTVLPIALAVSLGAPPAASLFFLCMLVVVLSIVVYRRRRRV
jgi:hypothetical protein